MTVGSAIGNQAIVPILLWIQGTSISIHSHFGLLAAEKSLDFITSRLGFVEVTPLNLEMRRFGTNTFLAHPPTLTIQDYPESEWMPCVI